MDIATVILIVLGLAIVGLLVVIVQRQAGAAPSEQPVDTPAPAIDHSVLVAAVREAVDAQIRKTTSETLADT
ncbi:MAG: hypothetical protein ACO3T1_09420, partial [Ilumatobacteraceae bacterium]